MLRAYRTIVIKAIQATTENVQAIYELISATRTIAVIGAVIACLVFIGIWLELRTIRHALEPNKPGPITEASRGVVAVVGSIVRCFFKRRMND